MKLRFFSSLLLLTFLLGCTGQATIPTSNQDPIGKPLNIVEARLSPEDKAILKDIKYYIQEGNQVLTELELLISEFQKEDALDDALDAMMIAREELDLLLNKTVILQPQDKILQQLTVSVINSLEPIIDGLKLQIEGIDRGDSQAVQQGYQKAEQYKKEFYNLVKEYN